MRQREIKAQREKHGRSIVLEKKKCLEVRSEGVSGEVSIGEEGEGRSFRVEGPRQKSRAGPKNRKSGTDEELQHVVKTLRGLSLCLCLSVFVSVPVPVCLSVSRSCKKCSP